MFVHLEKKYLTVNSRPSLETSIALRFAFKEPGARFCTIQTHNAPVQVGPSPVLVQGALQTGFMGDVLPQTFQRDLLANMLGNWLGVGP